MNSLDNEFTKMAFELRILEMEVIVTEALRNAADCRCFSETLELSL